VPVQPAAVELLAALDRAILASAASTGVDTRTAVADYGRALTRHASTANPFTGALAVWVENVIRHAYKTLPAEVAALRSEGLSEDEIFEVTVAAAYGAARGRYDQALRALDEGYGS
jgi:alkylhydroperoxidase family enzyme